MANIDLIGPCYYRIHYGIFDTDLVSDWGTEICMTNLFKSVRYNLFEMKIINEWVLYLKFTLWLLLVVFL